MTPAQRRYLAVEMAVAAAISAVLSGVFVAVLFGRQAQVPVAGWGGLIVDALPQTLMIALMSSLVPTLLTRRRVRAGAVAPVDARRFWPKPVGLRVASLALGATAAAGVLHAVLLPPTGPLWSLGAVYVFKIAYGAALGATVARFATIAALDDRPE